jgi:hypothetical protein
MEVVSYVLALITFIFLIILLYCLCYHLTKNYLVGNDNEYQRI